MTKNNRRDGQEPIVQTTNQIDAHELLWSPSLKEAPTRQGTKQPQQPTCPPGHAYERFWELHEMD
ncbi:MAG: hypothetical protein ACFCD0_10520 [Gemmataceae bacterium]